MQNNPDLTSSSGVPPDGSPSSNLWMLGEAPGAVEDRIGKPFVGPAGQYLDKGCRDASLIRSELFLWNIFSKRPPNNDISHYFTSPKCEILTFEGEEMVAGLRQMISSYKPNVIVALGAIPFYILTGKKGITKWRGSVVDCILVPGIKIYGSYHPSYVMRLMQEKGGFQASDKGKGINVYPTFVHDLKRASEQSQRRGFPIIKRKEILPENLYEVLSYLSWLKERKDSVVCDIETIPLDGSPPLVTRVGFAPTATEGISIPFIK